MVINSMSAKMFERNRPNDDIKRFEICLLTGTKILARRFDKCSVAIKVKLFKVYCVCVYVV